jgi:NADH-quinone oxidoreductase subunit M
LNNWWYTVFAASGVIFAAVYLLWMYQRVVFGEYKPSAKLHHLTDMNAREIFITAALVIFIVWIGIYPSTFLKVSEKSSARVIEQVMPINNITIE